MGFTEAVQRVLNQRHSAPFSRAIQADPLLAEAFEQMDKHLTVLYRYDRLEQMPAAEKANVLALLMHPRNPD